MTPQSLGAIIRSFKSASTRRINLLRGEQGAPVWQRGFFERVIRNTKELETLRTYIRQNPENWKHDGERYLE